MSMSKTSATRAKGSAPTARGKPAPKGDVRTVGPLIDDVVATKLLRDRLLREKVYVSSVAGLASAGVALVSVAVAAVLWMQPPQVKYYATDTNGRIIEMIPMDQPVNSESEVLTFATEAVAQAFTFDFLNYRTELGRARFNFTPEGWAQFEAALSENNALATVISNKMVARAVPTGAPIVRSQGLSQGVYGWLVEIPFLVTYEVGNNRSTTQIKANVIVKRRSPLEHPRALGISQFTYD